MKTRSFYRLLRIAIYILIGLSIWLGLSWYLRIESGWLIALPPWLKLPGSLILVVGLTFIVLGELALLARGGATGGPGDPTSRLVTGGVYAWVRNPIYLGGFLTLAGLGLVRRSPGLLGAASGFMAVLHIYVVTIEEPRTSRQFGEAYHSYTHRVNRWRPRFPDRKRSERSDGSDRSQSS